MRSRNLSLDVERWALSVARCFSSFGVRRLLMLSLCVERWTLSVWRFFSALGVRCWPFGVRRFLTLSLSVERWAHSTSLRYAQGRLLSVGRCLLLICVSRSVLAQEVATSGYGPP